MPEGWLASTASTRSFRPSGRWRALSRLVVALVIVSNLAGLISPDLAPWAPAPARATHTNIKMPFAAGASWYISQGYNTSPAEGWSHYNCDPRTSKDQISQTTSCSAGWQYKYSFDLRRSDGNTTGQPVLSPVNGTIRWIDNAYGGMSINLGDGYAVAFFHAVLASGLAAGQTVRQGQQLGTVAGPGGGGNGGTPHIHLTLWQTSDGGNWSRIAVPFSDQNRLDGYDFPAQSNTTRNQYWNRTVVSTNGATSVTSPPSTPVLRGPATGTTFTTAGTTPTLSWGAVSGATRYQVVINNGERVSDWMTGTSWTIGPLPDGRYSWQVRAKNDAGRSPLSGAWVFTIDTPDGPPPGTTADVSVSPTSGGVGTSATVTGTGYAPHESIGIHWDSASDPALLQTHADASGAFRATVAIPRAVRGDHRLIAVGASEGRAGAAYRVVPTLVREPILGSPGTPVTVTVNGFGAQESVKLTWQSATGPTLATVQTSNRGSGQSQITIPDATTGWTDYTGVGLTTGARAYGAIRVVPGLTASPAAGVAGTTIAAAARGFRSGARISVIWNRSATADGKEVCSGISNNVGRVNCSFAIPDGGGNAGDFPLVAVADYGGTVTTTIRRRAGSTSAAATDEASFQQSDEAVTADTVPGGSILSVGTYRVTGTREGLVGGVTSNNHTIKPNDHFVSLPACTATSCPWLTPGITHPLWGRRVECGANCFVRVTNPATGDCSVAPIYDVGPWFTNDDWWDPASIRVLNNLATTVHILPQGYTGADAARDGLNVGYGISSTGIGISNKGYVTGNRSAIDLADGTWTDIGLDFNAGIGTVVATFLWQSGEDPQAASRACGQSPPPTATPTPTPAPDGARITLSATSGQVGSSVTVTGSGFQAGETVHLTWDTPDSDVIASGTADGSGRIAVSFRVPSAPRGEHRVIARGVAGGRRGAATYAVGPSLDRSPVQGMVGTDVTVTLRGFGTNESVKLTWDSADGDRLAVATTNANGSGSIDITIPRASTGWHDYTGLGLTSGARGYGAIRVLPQIEITPRRAAPGEAIDATLTGYPASAPIVVAWNRKATVAGVTVCSGTTTSGGSFRCSFTVPGGANDGAVYPVVGQSGSTQAQVQLTVSGAASDTTKPVVTISPATGSPGDEIRVRVTGLAVGAEVQTFWANESEPVATKASDDSGAAGMNVTIPRVPAGDYRIRVVGHRNGEQASATVTVEPSLTLSPASGSTTSRIDATATGFASGATVDIYWNRQDASPGTRVCAGTANERGTFTCSFRPPTAAAGVRYPVVARTDGLAARATFDVTSGATTAQAASVDPGTPGAATSPTATVTGSPTATEPSTVAPERGTPKAASATPDVASPESTTAPPTPPPATTRSAPARLRPQTQPRPSRRRRLRSIWPRR